MAAEPASTVALGPNGLSALEVIAIARHGAQVEISPEAQQRMQESRERIEALETESHPVYGVSTGFGALVNTRIPADRRRELQEALLRSHAAGMGPPVDREVVRGMIALRARTLAMGYSGTRPLIAEALVRLLNAGITPFVPLHGSLGASGDLAPLAHVGLCLLGQGTAYDRDGRLVDAGDALQAAGMTPVRLEAKEGLSLINGTDGMLALLVLACEDLKLLFKTADVTAAMSVEALLGTSRPFMPELQQLRPHPGQVASAANLMKLAEGSEIMASHRDSEHAVQDSYSLRCSPQVVGAGRDTLAFANAIADRELISAIDNPVLLPDGTLESGGNFHGAPLGYACDFLSIAVADAGSIAERRTDRLLDPARSQGLPPFLAADPGIDSGLMLTGYTAAALVTENRRLAVPASTDSVPTSAMQEDHVSMGWSAGVKLRQSLRNLARILAVELLCSSFGLAFRAPLQPAPATRAVMELVLDRVGGPGPDRFRAPQLWAAEELVVSGAVVSEAERIAGQLA